MANAEDGPLDDQPAEVISTVRKLRQYDNFETFKGEIDGLSSLLAAMVDEAKADDRMDIACLALFMKDLALMLVHTRGKIEALEREI